MLEAGLLIFFPFLMIYASSSDLFTMTIPNRVSVLLIGGFFLFSLLMGLGFEQVLMHLLAFGVVLMASFGLFSINAMGGGDAKLAASTALWFGWSTHLMEYLLLTSLLGAILTLAFILGRTRYVPEFIGQMQWVRRLYNHHKVPYGIALGSAAVMVYPETPWMQHVINTYTAL